MLFARKFTDGHGDLVRQLDLHRAGMEREPPAPA
jgi:hypothetical protein